MSALRLINETTISSTVTEVDVDNIFSADFDIYKIVIDGVQESATGQEQWLRLRFLDSSGTVDTSSNYDYAHLRMISNSGYGTENNTNQNNILYAGLGYTDDDGTNAVAYIFNPYSSSSYTFMMAQGIFWNSGRMQSVKGIAVHTSAETIRGIKLYQSSGNMGSGIIRVYGLRVDS